MQAQRLSTIAHWMDDSIRLPGGYRVGWDGIIGLIPGLGDLAGLAVSAYIMAASIRMGASKSVLMRMALNTGIDAIVGAVPVFGDLFDLAFKANRRNIQLLQAHLDAPQRTRRVSMAWLSVIAAAVILILATVSILLVRLLSRAWNSVAW